MTHILHTSAVHKTASLADGAILRIASLAAHTTLKIYKYIYNVLHMKDNKYSCIKFSLKVQSWTLINTHMRNVSESAFPRTFQKCLFSVC